MSICIRRCWRARRPRPRMRRRTGRAPESRGTRSHTVRSRGASEAEKPAGAPNAADAPAETAPPALTGGLITQREVGRDVGLVRRWPEAWLAAGSGRDSGGRDPRSRDSADGAQRGRNRSPDPDDAAHARCEGGHFAAGGYFSARVAGRHPQPARDEPALRGVPAPAAGGGRGGRSASSRWKFCTSISRSRSRCARARSR